jgi:uncharacterized protein YfiM (DUF2279 family)
VISITAPFYYTVILKKLIFLIHLICAGNIYAQPDSSGFFSSSPVFSRERFTGVIVTKAALYGGLMTGLNVLWYKNYPKSPFHLFDDSNEWLQMDKVGHFTTSYYVGKLGIDVMKWTGMPGGKAALLGGMTGLLFETSVEIIDGFFPQWGFSLADMGANIAGTGLVIAEEFLWQEQRIQPRFSFHRSMYSQYRPGLLGSNLKENILKDYNGQTYWLSGNLASFGVFSGLPPWLNLAVGYGAEGMTGGMSNPAYSDGKALPVFRRERQFYLSLDVDLSRIKTRIKPLKAFFGLIGFLKVPAPALEFNEIRGLRFYPLYF